MVDFLNIPDKTGQDQQNQYLQQIATSLGATTDALNSAVNLANTAGNNANAKIADVENRFQQLTSKQQQDAEVVSARQSTVKSKTFASLDARLEEDEQDFKSHKADKMPHQDADKLVVNSTDDATSVTNAPLKSAGGLGVAKSIYIGGDFSKPFTLLRARYISISSNEYTPVANIQKEDGMMMLSIDMISFLQGIGNVAISYKATIIGTNVNIMREDIAGTSQTDFMKVEVEGDKCVVYVRPAGTAPSPIRMIIEVFTSGNKNITWL